MPMANVLKSKHLNNWNLFALISVPISLAVIIAASKVDLSKAEYISSMIQFSVRCSVPWLYLAFAASSLRKLWPTEFSKWLLRNRKIMGLCFAAAMAWQLTFILWMVIPHWHYYLSEVYLFGDILVQLPGYLILIAMSWTSFKVGRRQLSAKQWKLLHTIGIYFLWATVWSTYWYELYYYDDVQLIDYVYYWTGFLAWGLRIMAWSKQQAKMHAAKPA
ncbi:MAG: hypothetical protein ACR2P1_28380 [Pseudomonadales bacterium]